MKACLAIIPIKPQMNEDLKWYAIQRAHSMIGANSTIDLGIFLDTRTEPSLPSDHTPWSKVSRVRNKVLESIDLHCWDHLLWIDADIIDYPPDMPTRLIEGNPEGMSAPLVLIENSERFYDWAAFIIHGKGIIAPSNRNRIVGRNLQHDKPYWPSEPTTEIVDMDCVGAVTCVPTWAYRSARYEDHPAFTDHWPIAEAIRTGGKRVVCNRGVKVFHAELPKYGEAWH